MGTTKYKRSESTVVTFRIDNDLLKQLDEYWQQLYYTDRTTGIIEMIKNEITGTICPYCGAHNPRGGRICSVCLRPLDDQDWGQLQQILNADNDNRKD